MNNVELERLVHNFIIKCKAALSDYFVYLNTVVNKMYFLSFFLSFLKYINRKLLTKYYKTLCTRSILIFFFNLTKNKP